MQIGYPQAQEQFNRNFAKFADEIQKRQGLLEKIFVRTEATKINLADRYVFFLGTASYQDFQEILLLLGNGKATGATKILRSLYEKVVTATYLSRNPGEAQDFADYDAVNRQKLLDKVPSEIKERYLDPNLVSDIEKKYATVEEKFTTKSGKIQPNWTRFSVPTLAEKADPLLAKIYGPAFLLPTFYVHATALDVIGRTEASSGTLSLSVDSSSRSGRDVAINSHFLFYYMASVQNAHFQLGYDTEVEQAVSAYNECWAEVV